MPLANFVSVLGDILRASLAMLAQDSRMLFGEEDVPTPPPQATGPSTPQRDLIGAMPPPLHQHPWGPSLRLWVQAGFALQGGRQAGHQACLWLEQKKWNPSRNV